MYILGCARMFYNAVTTDKEIKKQLALLEKKTRELEVKEQKLYSTMLGGQ